MSNGRACCILGVCCPPGSPEQEAALAEEIAHSKGWGPGRSRRVAQEVLARTDGFRVVAEVFDAEAQAAEPGE